MARLATMRRAEIILPLDTVPRDGTAVRVRAARDGAWHEAVWNPTGPIRVDGADVVGRWETGQDGTVIAHHEIDAWRPSLARAIAVHREGGRGEPAPFDAS